MRGEGDGVGAGVGGDCEERVGADGRPLFYFVVSELLGTRTMGEGKGKCRKGIRFLWCHPNYWSRKCLWRQGSSGLRRLLFYAPAMTVRGTRSG